MRKIKEEDKIYRRKSEKLNKGECLCLECLNNVSIQNICPVCRGVKDAKLVKYKSITSKNIKKILEKKICRTCNQEKSIIEFYIQESGNYYNECKMCCRKRSKENVRKNKLKQKALKNNKTCTIV